MVMGILQTLCTYFHLWLGSIAQNKLQYSRWLPSSKIADRSKYFHDEVWIRKIWSVEFNYWILSILEGFFQIVSK